MGDTSGGPSSVLKELSMAVRIARRTVAILLVSLILPACGKFAGFGTPFAVVVVNAGLRGSQGVPAVATPSTGTAMLTVAGTHASIDYVVTYAGAGVINGVRIHLGAAGS